MSQQGLQRAQQLLQVLGTQLPSIAQASDCQGIHLGQFMVGTLVRSGVQLDSTIIDAVNAIASVINPETLPLPPTDPA